MLKIGEWVTQYRKGYWQIVDIIPKYAEEDYQFENGTFQKKGELIGSWVLMKKAFTPKMKFRIDSDTCDANWCKPVPPDVIEAIDAYFRTHPSDYKRYCSSPFIDHPAVSTTWLHITPEQEVVFREVIQTLPPKFTSAFAMRCFEERGLKQCFSLPPANFRFVCWHTLWEFDEDFNPLYKNPELRKD